MNSRIRRGIGQGLTVLAVMWAFGMAQGAGTTRYWGGGTATITDGTTLTPTNGNWVAAGIENWGDQDGVPVPETAVFNPWANGDTAVFGTRTTGYNVNIQASGITVGGLSSYKFDGTGVGIPSLTGPANGTATLSIVPGATINVAPGTTLGIASTITATQGALNMTNSGFTITGGGTFTYTAYSGTFVSSGTVTVDNAMFSIGSGPYQSAFSGNTLELVAPNGRYDQGRWDDWTASPWQAIVGTGLIQPNSATVGFRPIGLNNAVDSVLDALVLNGTTYGVVTVLYKTGIGKLTVMNGGNNYFGNFVRNGMLSPGAANTVKGWVLVDGSSTATGVFGTSDASFFTEGSVTAASGGQINGANLALGQYQLMAGGAVKYDAPGDIPGSGRVLDGAQKGAVIVGGYAFDDTLLQRVKESFDGVIALGANIGSGTTLHLDGLGGNFAKARLGAWGAARTFSGTLVPNGGVYRLGGGNNTLTLSAALTGVGSLDVGNGGNKGFFGQGATALPASGVALTADNTLSGPVTVGNVSTLTLSGANGRLSGATGITVTEGGALALADAGGSNGDRIPSVELKLLKSGSFTFVGNSANLEAVGALTVDGGYSTLSAARGNASGTTVLQFANANPANWGMANFTLSNSQIKFSTPPAADGALLGPWALTGSSRFAAYQASSGIAQPVTTTVNSAPTWQACGSSSNAYINSTFTATVNGTVGSVVIDASSARTLGWTGKNTVVNGGILVTGYSTATFNGGQWTSGTPDRGLYLYNLVSYGATTINSDIVDNDGSPVTLVAYAAPISGVVLSLTSANNSFSGGVVVNGGLLRATTSGALGTGSDLVLNGRGATLELNGSDARVLNQNITVNADGTLLGVAGTGGSTTLNGNITLNNGSLLTLGVYTLPQPITVNSAIGGAGSLRLQARPSTTITLQGSNANTYSGDTIVAALVALNKSSGNAIPGDAYLGTVESANPGAQRPTLRLSQSNQIADTAVLTFGGGVGGTNTLYMSPALKLNGKNEEIAGLSSLFGNGVVENGSNTTASVLTLSGSGSTSFGGLVWNGAGGSLALVKSGTGTQALTGANSYTGGTTVTGGTLLVGNTVGSGTGGGSVTVGASGTLGGNGRVAPGTGKAITVGGTLAPGASIGTLMIDLGSTALGATLSGGAKFAYELGAPGNGDKLKFVNFGAGDLVLNNNVVDVTDAGGLAEGQYTVMEFYSDNGVTLTDVGKPTSGLVLGSGFTSYASSRFVYSQTGKIILDVQKTKGTIFMVR